MQYVMTFMAVCLVVVGMIIFLFLALKQTAIRLKEQIDSRFLEELSVFDRLYEEKTDRLRQLEEKKNLADSNLLKKELPGDRERPVTVETREMGEIPVSRTFSPDFKEEYRYVKQAFSWDIRELVKRLAVPDCGDDGETESKEAGRSGEMGKAAEEILKVLSEQTAFELSTLSGEEQLAFLSEVLGPAGNRLLERYREKEQNVSGEFGVLKFLTYVGYIRQLDSGSITVYVPDDSFPEEPGIRVVCDASICEGVRIVKGSRLYDYSL